MTAPPATGRFDVRATGELCGSFDAAEERARLLGALNGDHDLCSALLCGEAQLLCSGVEWAAAQAFAALMRDCGVVTEVVGHGDSPAPTFEAKPLLKLVECDAESAQQEQGSQRPEPTGSTWATRARRPQVYEAEVVEESAAAAVAPAVSMRADTVVSSGGGDIPLFLLEADARERDERLRLRRRWGLASAVVVMLASLALFSGGERTLNSQQAYVHLLASPVRSEVDGVVAELLVEPRQLLRAGDALAVIAPEGGVRQRHIEAAPVEGTVDQIIVRSGQKVRRGQPLLTLAQPGSAYLLVYFSSEQLQKLPERAPVRIELDDFPGQPLLGRLAAVQSESSSGESRSGRRSVRVDFEDRPPLLERLRSGMAGSVTVRLDNALD